MDDKPQHDQYMSYRAKENVEEENQVRLENSTDDHGTTETDKNQKCGFFKAVKHRVTRMLSPRPKESHEVEASLSKAEEELSALKSVLEPLDTEMKNLRSNINSYMKQLELYRFTFSWLSKREELDEAATMDMISHLKERFQDASPLEVVKQCSESELEIYIALLRTEIYVLNEHKANLVSEVERLWIIQDPTTASSASSISFSVKTPSPTPAVNMSALPQAKTATLHARRMTFPFPSDNKNVGREKNNDCPHSDDEAPPAMNPRIAEHRGSNPPSFTSMSHCKSVSMVNLDRLLKENVESHQCNQFHNFSQDEMHFNEFEEENHDCNFCSNYKHKLLEMEHEQLYQMNLLQHTLTHNSIYLHDQKERNKSIENKLDAVASENKKQIANLLDLVNQSGKLLKSIEQEYATCCEDIYNQIEVFVEDRNKMENEILLLKEDNEQLLQKFVNNSKELQLKIREIPNDPHKLKTLCVNLYEDLLLAILAYEKLQNDLKKQINDRKKYDNSSCNLWLKKLKDKEIDFSIKSDRTKGFFKSKKGKVNTNAFDEVRDVLLDIVRTINHIDCFDKDTKTWILDSIEDVKSKVAALELGSHDKNSNVSKTNKIKSSKETDLKHATSSDLKDICTSNSGEDSSNAAKQKDSSNVAEQKDSFNAAEQKNSSNVAEQKDSSNVAEQKDSSNATEQKDPKLAIEEIKSSKNSDSSIPNSNPSSSSFSELSHDCVDEPSCSEVNRINAEEKKLFDAYDKIISEVRAYSDKLGKSGNECSDEGDPCNLKTKFPGSMKRSISESSEEKSFGGFTKVETADDSKSIEKSEGQKNVLKDDNAGSLENSGIKEFGMHNNEGSKNALKSETAGSLENSDYNLLKTGEAPQQKIKDSDVANSCKKYDLTSDSAKKSCDGVGNQEVPESEENKNSSGESKTKMPSEKNEQISSKYRKSGAEKGKQNCPERHDVEKSEKSKESLKERKPNSSNEKECTYSENTFENNSDSFNKNSSPKSDDAISSSNLQNKSGDLNIKSQDCDKKDNNLVEQSSDRNTFDVDDSKINKKMLTELEHNVFKNKQESDSSSTTKKGPFDEITCDGCKTHLENTAEGDHYKVDETFHLVYIFIAQSALEKCSSCNRNLCRGCFFFFSVPPDYDPSIKNAVCQDCLQLKHD